MTTDIRTLFIRLQDHHDTQPWAVAAFNARAGMVMWHPGIGRWVEKSPVLAPYFMLYETGSWPITEAEAADLVRRGIGPPGPPHDGDIVEGPAVDGLPTAPPTASAAVERPPTPDTRETACDNDGAAR